MAAEIQLRDTETGVTIYAVIANLSGQYYVGTTAETLVNAHWATYAVAMTETPAGSYRYQADFPALPYATYAIEIYKRIGGTPAQTDTLLKVDSIAWSGASVIDDAAPVTSDFNALTAKEVLMLVSNEFGLYGQYQAERQAIAQSDIIDAYREVWNKRPWPFRLISDATLMTDATNSYVAVPTDFGKGDWQADDFLIFSDLQSPGCLYVRPDRWQAVASAFTGKSRPMYFTVRQRTITGVQATVVDFAPAPDAVYVLSGFQYYRKAPALDFTSDVPAFPFPEFDTMWKALCTRNCSRHGWKSIEPEDRRMNQYEAKQTVDEMTVPLAIQNIQLTGRQPRDTYGDNDDARSGSVGFGFPG